MSIFHSTPALRRLARALRREARSAARDLEDAFDDLARSFVRRSAGEDDVASGYDAASTKVAALLSRIAAASDLAGRLDLRWGTKAPEPEQFADDVPDMVPAVEFEAAIRDLLERDPFGAAELERAGLEVEDVYGGVSDGTGRTFYPHGFAAARAIEAEVARKVRDRIAAAMALGTPTGSTAAILAEEWTWPRAYAEVVTRNAVNTASTAGRFKEAERVRAAGIPVGFRYRTAGDVDVRRGRPQDHGENHAALDGLVARTDDPIWRRFSPPGGMNCRCVLEPVIGDEVPDHFVTAPPGARFAPGFGSRPDLRSRP